MLYQRTLAPFFEQHSRLSAVGLPVAGFQSDCRQAVPASTALGKLDHRQFAGPSSSRSAKASTRQRRCQRRAVPGGDRRQAVPGRRRGSTPAADRAGRGLVRVSECSITGSSSGSSSSRSVHPATRRSQRQGRTVPGGDRRQAGQGEGNPWLPWLGQDLGWLDHQQFFRVFVLTIAQGCRGATMAPASSGTGAIASKLARAKARQRTDCRSGLL